MARTVTRDRISKAFEHYEHCTLCEHRCGVNRATIAGKCHASSSARVFRNRVELGEESFLNPCHLFYLSGCDLRCVFCINEMNAFHATRGHLLTPEFFQQALAEGKRRGSKTLQWVGGEPTIHLPAILHAMSEVDDLPPIVWKSDFHFTEHAFELLQDVVDVFVADFKFGNDECAYRLSGVKDYTQIITRNLQAAKNHARLIVRHLLLPGHTECCWKPIAAWLGEHLRDVELSLRGGYLPRWRAGHFTELNHPLPREALPAAHEFARHYALRVIQ